MVGGTTSGYWAMGSLTTATPPTMTITIDNTIAMIGRSMKKRDIGGPFHSGGESRPVFELLNVSTHARYFPDFGRRGIFPSVGATVTPGLARLTPSTMTHSSPFRPASTARRPLY